MKILLLEDELMLNNAISEYLRALVIWLKVFRWADVLNKVEQGYDLLILDVNVPNVDGFLFTRTKQ